MNRRVGTPRNELARGAGTKGIAGAISGFAKGVVKGWVLSGVGSGFLALLLGLALSRGLGPAADYASVKLKGVAGIWGTPGVRYALYTLTGEATDQDRLGAELDQLDRFRSAQIQTLPLARWRRLEALSQALWRSYDRGVTHPVSEALRQELREALGELASASKLHPELEVEATSARILQLVASVSYSGL